MGINVLNQNMKDIVKGTTECWSQKKRSCIFIEMVWNNCVCLKVKSDTIWLPPQKELLMPQIVISSLILLFYGQFHQFLTVCQISSPRFTPLQLSKGKKLEGEV